MVRQGPVRVHPRWWPHLQKNSGRSPADLDACQPSPSRSARSCSRRLQRQMTDKDDKGRYHNTVDAMLYNPDTKKCDHTLMGLVGFHISINSNSSPSGSGRASSRLITSSGPDAGPNTPISFNNGLPTPATTGGWADRPKQKRRRSRLGRHNPAQVTRLNATEHAGQRLRDPEPGLPAAPERYRLAELPTGNHFSGRSTPTTRQRRRRDLPPGPRTALPGERLCERCSRRFCSRRGTRPAEAAIRA